MRPSVRDPRWLPAVGALALVVAGLGALATRQTPEPTPDRAAVAAWVTSPQDDARRLLGLEPTARPATARVRVDPGAPGQEWRGTGAAMTDASTALLAEGGEGLSLLFDPEAADGARLDWVRLPLSATDMSPQVWTWGWDGTTASPGAQASAAADLVSALSQVAPDLSVVATPWTAPAWMKDSGDVRGGALRDDQVDSYAAMLVAQVDELRSGGVPVAALTLGNEPGHSADYPSMTMTDEQQARLARLVGPDLRERAVELWAVDHNWADRPRYQEVLAAAPDEFDAAAFHCYFGSPAQMAGLAVPPVVTECTGTTSSWEEGFAWDARHLVAESLAAGATGLMMWNLAVDPQGGPRDLEATAGCATCRGLLTVDGDGVQPGPEFYVLAHLARAASPGARVLGSTATDGLWEAAFARTDGTVGVFVHNDTGRDQVVSVEVPGEDGQVAPSWAVRAGELLSVRVGG